MAESLKHGFLNTEIHMTLCELRGIYWESEEDDALQAWDDTWAILRGSRVMAPEEEQKIGMMVTEHRRLSTFPAGDDGEGMRAWVARMFPEPEILTEGPVLDLRQHLLPL